MSTFEIFVIFIITLCVCYLFMYFMWFRVYTVVDDRDRDVMPRVENNNDRASSTIQSTTTKPSSNNKIQRKRLNFNTEAILKKFVEMEKHNAEYDGKPFEYPKSVENLETLNNWTTDSTVLRKITNSMLFALAISIHNNKSCHKNIITFIDKFNYKFLKLYKKNDVQPWGNESISFIDTSILLAMFMISSYSSKLQKTECSKIISRIIASPGVVFKEKLPAIHIVHTSIPWLLAKYNDGVSISLSDENYIINSMSQIYSDIPNNGFHNDKSFTFGETFSPHTPNHICSKYRYDLLSVMIPQNTITYVSATKQLNEIIIHPTIKQGIYGINVFDINNKKLTSDSVYLAPNNNYGIVVMPLIRLLRLFTQHYCFAVRGFMDRVKPTSDSINSVDQTIPRQQLYNMQLRTFIHAKTTTKYPDFGCVIWSGNDELKNTTMISLSKATSYVFKYENVGIFFQSYTVQENNEIDYYTIDELITIKDNVKEQIIDIYIRIINYSTSKMLMYYGYENRDTNTNLYSSDNIFEIKQASTTFHTQLKIIDQNIQTVKQTSIVEGYNPFILPIQHDDGITLNRSGRGIIINAPNKPTYYCPIDELTVTNSQYHYKSSVNQWTNDN